MNCISYGIARGGEGKGGERRGEEWSDVIHSDNIYGETTEIKQVACDLFAGFWNSLRLIYLKWKKKTNQSALDVLIKEVKKNFKNNQTRGGRS